jgi:putative ABC transport system permease protein
VALAVILVVGAGLMVRTLAALGDIDLGFNPDRVLTMRVTISGAKYPTNENVEFLRRAAVAGERVAGDRSGRHRSRPATGDDRGGLLHRRRGIRRIART